MKGLLEEANKMLKSMNAPKVEEREGKLDKLQKQLDELKHIKVFRLTEIEVGVEEGLLDSGATHPLRSKKRGEDLRGYREILVALACGKQIPLRMSPGGVMVTQDEKAEPIVPLGRMVKTLRCRIEWKEEDGLIIHHPTRGEIQTVDRGGCPHVSKKLALQLIDELEEAVLGREEADGEMKKLEEDEDREEKWIRDFVECHPVLSSLPNWIKSQLIGRPSQTPRFPKTNKRRRKRWYKYGLTVHLYSGEEEGYTLTRAVKEQGGNEELVLEVDVKNGQEWDMLYGGCYESLLRLALDNVIEGVICGPNCRTRSSLRHIPIPGNPNAPRPVREWGGEEWGRKDLTKEEKKKVEEDDVLMWRAIMIGLVAVHVRRAQQPETEEPRFLVEQPAEDARYPETVSWWRTEEWKKLRRMYDWKEVHFRQGDMGGKTTKPTTVGGDLVSQMPPTRDPKSQREVRSSKDLERWAPGMMRTIAEAIVEKIQKRRVKIKALSWDEHVLMGHVPFRRDCRICQETRQRQNPHRRVQFPLSGVLSLDTAGPYKDGNDLVMKSRYLMVGAFTWAVPKGTKGMDEVEAEVPEGAPEIEKWEDQRKKKEEDERSPEQGPHRGEREDERSPEQGPHRGEREDERSPEQGPQEGEREDEVEGKEKEEEWEIKVFRMTCPLATKRTEETLRVAIEFILRLRADGYTVSQIHTDQGHEYYGQFREWCDRRGIQLSRTPGDDPQGNGRAEATIQAVTMTGEGKPTPCRMWMGVVANGSKACWRSSSRSEVGEAS